MRADRLETGWVTVFAWQATVSSIFYLVSSEIQGLWILNYPEYNAKRWHATLLMWAVLILNFSINVFAIRILPVIQLIGGIFHVTFFVILVVPLILLAPRSTPEFVFMEVLNEGGYDSNGISWCIGLLTVTYAFLGRFLKARPLLRNVLMFPRLRRRNPYERRSSQCSNRDSQDTCPDHTNQRRSFIRIHASRSLLYWRCYRRPQYSNRLPHHSDLLPSNRICASRIGNDVPYHHHWSNLQSGRRSLRFPPYMGFRSRWRSSLLHILCQGNSSVYIFHQFLLTHLQDRPHIPRPVPSNRPSLRNRNNSLPNQHRKHHSLNRHPGHHHFLPLHLLHHPYFPARPQAPHRPSLHYLRPLDPGPLGPFHQPLRHRIWHLHRHLCPLPDGAAGHARKYELLRAGAWGLTDFAERGLVR